MTGMRDLNSCGQSGGIRWMRKHLRHAHATTVAGQDLRAMNIHELIQLHHTAQHADRAAAMTRPVSKQEMAAWIREKQEAVGAGNCWCSPRCDCPECSRGDCMNCKDRFRW
jgi:hypothetical protein